MSRGMVVLQANLQAFGGGNAGERKAAALDPGLTLRYNAVDHGIAVTRIMMVQHQLLGSGLLGNMQGIEIRRMAPAKALRVFFGRVLRILNQHIGVTRQMR